MISTPKREIQRNVGDWIYYNPECKECTKARYKKWRIENPEKRKEIFKRENAKPSKKAMIRKIWRRKRENGDLKEWQRNNKAKIKTYRIKRESTKTHEISQEEWIACKEYFNYKCAYCEFDEKEHKKIHNQQLHREHVDDNGSNRLDNCVPSCKKCNSGKNVKSFEEWYNGQTNKNYTIERYERIVTWLKYTHKKYMNSLNTH